MADFGPMNGHVVGTLMKEAVRRAMVAIRGHRFTFEATAKSIRADGGHDFVTTADHAAQRVFVKLLRDWFPGFGIVAEEGELAVPSERGDLWFTVDPLDGTKAFIRRQSHGIGTMIALVERDRVIGACVGDVMTQEVYSARPESDRVHRISEFGIAETLAIDEQRPLATQWLMLRDRVEMHSACVRALVDDEGALFPSCATSSGSIGIAMARLWKGEVGAAVLGPIARATPWDIAPIIGICERLGFEFYSVLDVGRLVRWEPRVRPDFIPIDNETLVVHRSRRDELEAWAERVRR